MSMVFIMLEELWGILLSNIGEIMGPDFESNGTPSPKLGLVTPTPPERNSKDVLILLVVPSRVIMVSN